MHTPVTPFIKLLAIAILSGGLAAATTTGATRLAIAPDGASPTSFVTANQEVSLTGSGGFRIYDATRRTEVALPRGTLVNAGTTQSFRTANAEVRLVAASRPRMITCW